MSGSAVSYSQGQAGDSYHSALQGNLIGKTVKPRAVLDFSTWQGLGVRE